MPLTYRPYAESWTPKKTAFQNPYQSGTGVNPATGLPWGMVDQGYTGSYTPVPQAPGGGGTIPLPQTQQQTNPYADLINNMLNQTRADLAAGSAADKASRDAQLRRLMVSYGEIPDFAGLGISEGTKGILGEVADDPTRELALKNTQEGTSISARIAAAHEIAQRQIGQQQAASGRLRSGDTGYRYGQETQQNKVTKFDTLNQMLGEAEGAVGSFAAAERGRQRELAAAEQNAAWQNASFWAGQDFGPESPLTPPPGAPTSAAPGSGPLSQAEWLARNPNGNYANYLQAYRRHQQQLRGGMSGIGGGGV